MLRETVRYFQKLVQVVVFMPKNTNAISSFNDFLSLPFSGLVLLNPKKKITHKEHRNSLKRCVLINPSLYLRVVQGTVKILREENFEKRCDSRWYWEKYSALNVRSFQRSKLQLFRRSCSCNGAPPGGRKQKRNGPRLPLTTICLAAARNFLILQPVVAL